MLNQKITPPSHYLTSLEGFRTFTSLLDLAKNRAYLRGLAKGDGHTVMVLPGFLAGDYSTLIIRRFLKHWGYQARPWNLGLNLGLSKKRDLETLMREQLTKNFQDSGEKISLVGWSLGGVFARELARHNPHMVRSVITLGSPFGDDPRGTKTGGIYQFVTGNKFDSPEMQARIKTASQPVPHVPCTAIYSKSDGIVSWKIATETESDIAENIEVKSAHTGLGVNASVMFALADRLRQKEGEWTAFDKTQTDRFYYK